MAAFASLEAVPAKPGEFAVIPPPKFEVPIDIRTRNNILVRDETVKPDCGFAIQNGSSIIGTKILQTAILRVGTVIWSQNFDDFEKGVDPPCILRGIGRMNQFMARLDDGCRCFSKILEVVRNCNSPKDFRIAGLIPRQELFNNILGVNNRINVSLLGTYSSASDDVCSVGRFFGNSNLLCIGLPQLVSALFQTKSEISNEAGGNRGNYERGITEQFSSMEKRDKHYVITGAMFVASLIIIAIICISRKPS